MSTPSGNFVLSVSCDADQPRLETATNARESNLSLCPSETNPASLGGIRPKISAGCRTFIEMKNTWRILFSIFDSHPPLALSVCFEGQIPTHFFLQELVLKRDDDGMRLRPRMAPSIPFRETLPIAPMFPRRVSPTSTIPRKTLE